MRLSQQKTVITDWMYRVWKKHVALVKIKIIWHIHWFHYWGGITPTFLGGFEIFCSALQPRRPRDVSSITPPSSQSQKGAGSSPQCLPHKSTVEVEQIQVRWITPPLSDSPLSYYPGISQTNFPKLSGFLSQLKHFSFSPRLLSSISFWQKAKTCCLSGRQNWQKQLDDAAVIWQIKGTEY